MIHRPADLRGRTGTRDRGRSGPRPGVAVGPETVQRYLNQIKTATYPQLLADTIIDALLIKEPKDFEDMPVFKFA